MRAELSAILRLDGKLLSSDMKIRIRTEHSSIARKLVIYLQSFGIEREPQKRSMSNDAQAFEHIKIHFVGHAKRRKFYDLELPVQGRVSQLLEELGLINTSFMVVPGIRDRIVERTCCKKSYVRGLFLAGGYLSDPQQEYHFEIAAPDQTLAYDVIMLLKEVEIAAKTNSKHSTSLVYIKKVEDILRILAVMGAYDTFLKLENARIFKELKNTANRQVNCDTYNVRRSTEAAVVQIRAIERLFSADARPALSPKLTEMADLRLENPQATLAELGLLAQPVLSRAAVQHRLERLVQLSNALPK